MYSYILLILFNIIVFYYLKKKIDTDNSYTKERVMYQKIKIKKITQIINISSIFISIIFYLVFFLNNYELNIIDILLFVVAILSYIIIELNIKKIDKRFKFIDKKLMDKKDYLIICSSLVILLSGRITLKYDNLDIILYIIMSLIIIISLWFILSLLMANKDKVCYRIKQEEYLEDIKFNNKIEISKTFNYFIYIFSFIIFVYIRFPFIILFYILIAIILFYVILKKSKKIKVISDKLYKTITITKAFPGITFAFQFMKDILLLKKLFLTLIFFVLSITALYGLGESAFTFIAIELYIILLYTIINDKIYLIRYISSLNEKFINKKIYTIDQIKPISFIDTINIFDIKLYKLIIVDNIIYESNIILYDPELITKEINIKINKSNLEDYIIVEDIFYRE